MGNSCCTKRSKEGITTQGGAVNSGTLSASELKKLTDIIAGVFKENPDSNFLVLNIPKEQFKNFMA